MYFVSACANSPRIFGGNNCNADEGLSHTDIVSNKGSFFQRLVRASFCDSLECACGEDKSNVLPGFRNVDLTSLEVSLSAHLAAGVELRRTRAV